jgi:hypothetical protein
MSCSYEVGDRVKATCMVSTAGCLMNQTMLFECKAMCDTQNPGTIVDETKWGLASRCDAN